MDHRDFLAALSNLVAAYAVLGRAIAAALPDGLADATRIDAVTLAAGEEFGRPLVTWFGWSSGLRGARVGDGTVVLDAPPGGHGHVLFLAGVQAEHERELPGGWRDEAWLVGRIDGESLEVLEG